MLPAPAGLDEYAREFDQYCAEDEYASDPWDEEVSEHSSDEEESEDTP